MDWNKLLSKGISTVLVILLILMLCGVWLALFDCSAAIQNSY